MKHQRGVIAQLYLYLAGGLALLAILGGLVYAARNLEERIDKAGYDRGVTATDAAYKERDNAQLQKVIAAQAAAEERAKAAEDAAAAAQSSAMVAYTKGVNDGKNKVADLVASGHRLFDTFGTSAGVCPASSSATRSPTLIAAAPGTADPTGCELSIATSAALYKLSGEADDTARRLTAAQARIVSDYELCK